MKKQKKVLNNKGFSLVELIIVIAIMAILAGALAPQLIKYLDKSRKATDVQTAQTIATAVNAALADESAYPSAKDITLSTNLYPATGTVTDTFYSAVKDILGTTEPKPKFNSNTMTTFLVDFASDGKSFKIYTYNGSTAPTDIDELYPNVGSNYK